MQHSIVPGILTQKYLDIQTLVGQASEYVQLVQLDICDGVFVHNKTWPYTHEDMRVYHSILQEEDGLPYWETVNYELDLMVKNAHTLFFTDWIKLGPTHIVFHLDAEEPKAFLSFFENLDSFYRESIQIGIAIETDTPIEKLHPFIPYISFVQCMGIDTIGVQGQPFSEKAITQIETVRKLFPNMKITVDGGVNKKVIERLIQYDISRFVVGSALFSAFDFNKTVQEFENIVR